MTQRIFFRNYKYLTLIFVIAVGVVLTFLGFKPYVLANQKQIMPIYVDNLEIDGRAVSVKGDTIYLDGRAQNLADNVSLYRKYIPYINFYILTKVQPLFASENLNTDRFEASVKYLAERQAIIRDDAGLENNVVPINFLTSLPDVSRANTIYLENPNTQNGLSLIQKYQITLNNYLGDTKVLLSSYEKYYPEDREQRFNPLASNSTNLITISDLELVLRNGEEIQREINVRKNLLLGKSGTFDASVPKRLGDYKTYVTPKFLDKEHELAVDSVYLDKLSGPYVVTTSCFLKDNDSKFFYIYNSALYDRKIFLAKQVDENYYNQLQVTTTNQREFQPIVDAGLKYVLQPEGNTYTCDDLTYQSKLLVVDEFQKKYGNSPILPSNDFEKKYYDDGYKSFENLDSLKNYYFDAYLDRSKLEDDESVKISKELLSRYLFIESQTVGIERIFDTAFFLDYAYNLNHDYFLQKSRADYVVTRSAYSMTLFTFTPTVWKIAEKPQFLTKNLNVKRAETYTSLVGSLGAEYLKKVNDTKTTSQTAAGK